MRLVRRELGRVKQGMDAGVVKDVLGMDIGIASPTDEAGDALDDVMEEGALEGLSMTSRKSV